MEDEGKVTQPVERKAIEAAGAALADTAEAKPAASPPRARIQRKTPDAWPMMAVVGGLGGTVVSW